MNGTIPASSERPTSLSASRTSFRCDRVGDAEIGVRLRTRRHRLTHILRRDRRLPHRVQAHALQPGAQPHDVETRSRHQRARRAPDRG